MKRCITLEADSSIYYQSSLPPYIPTVAKACHAIRFAGGRHYEWMTDFIACEYNLPCQIFPEETVWISAYIWTLIQFFLRNGLRLIVRYSIGISSLYFMKSRCSAQQQKNSQQTNPQINVHYFGTCVCVQHKTVKSIHTPQQNQQQSRNGCPHTEIKAVPYTYQRNQIKAYGIQPEKLLLVDKRMQYR